MAANDGERREDLTRMFEPASQQDRRDELGDDVPRRPGRFGAVIRIRIGDAFTDACRPAVFDGDQNELPIGGSPEARFEVPNERQVVDLALPAQPIVSPRPEQTYLKLRQRTGY